MRKRDASKTHVVVMDAGDFSDSDAEVVATLDPAGCIGVDYCGASGVCSRGECICAEGWTGDQCETRMTLPEMVWRAGAWGECSAECNGGTQTREVRKTVDSSDRTERSNMKTPSFPAQKR